MASATGSALNAAALVAKDIPVDEVAAAAQAHNASVAITVPAGVATASGAAWTGLYATILPPHVMATLLAATGAMSGTAAALGAMSGTVAASGHKDGTLAASGRMTASVVVTSEKRGSVLDE